MAIEPVKCATPGCDGMDAFQLIGVVRIRDAEIERQKAAIKRLRYALSRTMHELQRHGPTCICPICAEARRTLLDTEGES